jgi:uncharacterized protein (TIGR03790 family)
MKISNTQIPLAVVYLALALADAQPSGPAPGEPPGQAARVLVVVNDASATSRTIGQYYAQRRNIPAKNICHIQTPAREEIERGVYDREVAAPILTCLQKQGLVESVYYIVTTMHVPLKIAGNIYKGLDADYASVDSELALLYNDLKSGRSHELRGGLANPFFGRRDRPFSHAEFPIYLVTRLAGYELADVKAMIDRSLQASNRGKFIFDLRGPGDEPGDDWLRNAAILLPANRAILEETTKPVYDQKDVIGYASWGSNDRHHDRRFVGFRWLPGAIMTEYVSSDARTFTRPPEGWKSSQEWGDRTKWFAGSPQSMSADYIAEGATGASGHVYEPYLNMNPRPDLIFPAYFSGRNLAESYYLGLPELSWQNIVLGDPLCTLGPPAP